ncbi:MULTISPECIES: ABC transporter permease [Desulfovibrio]|jgi:ABC-type nitrate/sulfonate/bicarbonate transport system permease component|uniref:ABC transporter permease n=1 Tax=Desulfovibrio TaxID=872 RepID=UPI002A4C3AE9|nr:ABC transporter permease [Desulfovibrio sp.]MDY0306023.1 ABC transporter permease [Desulfovibrionaceae bacterium]HMM38832.1 ABC transporter permease [Desulfovibrio sp.]
MSNSAESVCNEVILRAGERKRITLGRVLRNEYFLNTVSLIAFFGFWHWAAASQVLGSSSALATPFQVVDKLHELFTETLAGLTMWGHILASLKRVLIGFLLAALLGVPMGLLMALNPYVNAVVKPIVDIFKPMPPLAWISVAILWFGIQETPKIFIIVIGSFVPALLNAYNSVLLIEPELYDVVRVMGGSRWDEVRQVCIPASLPAISAGLQIAMSSAWGCVLAAELVSSRSGLGYIIIQGMKVSDPAMVLGGMVVIAAIAWILSQAMDWLDRKLCPWRRDIKGL